MVDNVNIYTIYCIVVSNFYSCRKYYIVPLITKMICTDYTNHQYDICKTVTELCELYDDVADICSLLEALCMH